jgi:hypothetical protein
MFLPILLLRDFGPLSFIVFAVPNVLGAAAMGWVLRTRRDSDDLTHRHSSAAVWFSAVTLLFQVFFLTFLVSRSSSLFPLPLAAVIVLATFSAAFLKGTFLGAIVYLISLALALSYLAMAGWPTPGEWVRGLTPGDPASAAGGLVWLTPVTCFGFLLCPYLDLTFHKARAALDPRSARAAFSVGFGVFFLSMILFTLAYAGEFLGRSASAAAAFLVFLHIALQASFTVGIHLRAIANAPRAGRFRGGVRSVPWWLGIAAIAALLVFLVQRLVEPGPAAAPPPEIDPAFETIYRIFMSFYGLVFPAYAWLCKSPTRDGHAGPSPRKLAVWAAAVLIAAPMFWMGFIERQTWWLGPGLAVVLLARLALPRRAAAA